MRVVVDPLKDTVDRISWGWLPLLYDVDLSQWIMAHEAGEASSLSPAALKRWAEHGILSQLVSGRRRGRFYLRSELEVIRCVTRRTGSRDGAPNLRVVQAHIEDVALKGFR